MDGAEPMKWTIEFEHVPLRFSPVGAAAEAMLEMDGEELGCALATEPDRTEGLSERLAAAPPVAEDEYLRLTTRLEVLEIATEWLRAVLDDAFPGREKRYSEEDYDELFQPE